MRLQRCIEVWKMGTVCYLDALKLQEKLLAERKVGKVGDTLLSLQHPPTYTLGKRRTFHNLLVPETDLKSMGAELHYTERGGDITFHGPHQAILYPIISLRDIGYGARKYVESLELSMIQLASLYGVKAYAGKTDIFVNFKMISETREFMSSDLTFMELALEQAKLAMSNLEVPVGCVIVEDGKVIASGSNRTNETRNATRHAEMEAIDVLLEQRQKAGLSQLEVAEKFSRCILYVTCEPCIMCATALSIIGIREVYYGCANDKFGGCGSILSLHESGSEQLSRSLKGNGFRCCGGLMASEAVALLRSFYEQGNPNAPKPHRPIRISPEGST